MAGGFQFNRQQGQNPWGMQNNSGQYNGNNNNNNGPGTGNNFNNGQQQGSNNSNGPWNRNFNNGGSNQGPSYNSYGKSDGPMDPPRGQQNTGRQGQGPPGQPPRLFSPGPPGNNNSRPGSSSGPPQGPPGQPQRVFSPGPLSPGNNRPGPLSPGSNRPGSSSGPSPGGQQRPNPFPQGLGFDPARSQPTAPSSWITNKRLDLPEAAFAAGEGFASSLPQRPAAGNKSGKAIAIRVNQYKVTQFPTRDVYQYDINIGNGAEKMGKIMAVWKSKTCQEALRKAAPQAPLLWDGNKLAWSSVSIPELRFTVDLDKEKGRTPRPGKEDTCYVIIKQTKIVRMAVIQHYLERKTPFDNSVFEAINFLDHCMRQGPSEAHVMIKRSFFPKGLHPAPLDNVIMAVKGVYASIRLCDPKGSSGMGTGLAVNVDVANSTFWTAQDVHQAARNLLSRGNQRFDYAMMRKRLESVPYGKGSFTQSEDFKELRKMSKLKFKVKWFPKGDTKKAERVHTIKRFTFDPAHGRAGSNAKTYTFNYKDRQSGKEEVISVYAYFKRKYNVDLQHWYLPLISTERDGVFPMEACEIMPHQRYQFKLNPDQTSAMIKFAVTRPKERLESIARGVQMLNWKEDRYLNHFGVKMDPRMSITNAKLLQNPEIQFGKGKLNPRTAGRWDLRGQKFLKENLQPLKSWGFCIVNSACDEVTLQTFIKVFIDTYIGHGGRIENKNPTIINNGRADLAQTVADSRNAVGKAANANPQIIFYVLPGRDSMVYERLKRSMECRFGLVSQMLAVNHVRKANAQYCSNVCMKVNAKLGGVTCRVAGPPGPSFPCPTMFIGADVSHASPGSQQASTCAITMSMDTDATRYAAFVQTNGQRVEMITPENIESGFMMLFKYWVDTHKKGPEQVYYFRDGVSEGQYSHVLAQEIEPMKAAIIKQYGPKAANMKWTVTVCSKRHHIRFFPKDNDSAAGDRNGNALPGTLVERDVTHPFEYDFYLSSHSAIQGTARPTHYHVIKDDAKLDPTKFQNMIYQHCYQYARSTTPVSLYPAAYYAHLASNRARCHESSAASDGPKGGQKFEEQKQDAGVRERAGAGGPADATSQSGSTSQFVDTRPLVPLACDVKDPELLKSIRTSMWYI